MKKLALLFFLLASIAAGQGVRVGPNQVSQEASVYTSTNVLTIPSGATIQFCNYPANAVPCTNKATTYTDPTLLTSCPTSTQIVLDGTNTCVASPDAENNWGVWVSPGTYTYTIGINGSYLGPYFITAGVSNGGTINNANQYSSAYYCTAGNTNVLCGVANGLTGQVFTSTNGAAPQWGSPGIQDGNGGLPVTTTPYPLQCDSATALIDRGHILRLQSGAATITVPQSTATGCLLFVTTVLDDGAGTLTFNRTGSDVFTVVNGNSPNLDNQTSFQLFNGQYATLTQGFSGGWEIRITGTQTVQGALYTTLTNCIANGTAANPSVASCSSAAAGMFSCATNASTGTCQVNTTAVTANSEILITQDDADGGASQLNVTCNTGNVLSTTKPLLLSKSAGASFTINLGTVTTNPACFEFHIIN